MMGEEAVRSQEFQRFLPWGEKFLDEIRCFCTAQAEKLWRLYEAVGLPSKVYGVTSDMGFIIRIRCFLKDLYDFYNAQ